MPTETMHVVRIAPSGALVPGVAPRPEPGPHEALVRVHAAGVNRADLLQRRGRHAAPPEAPADIPGLEIAGMVERAPPGRWRPGDRVMAIVGGGGYAEYVRVDSRHLLAVPTHWSFEQAAAVPEAYLTAHDALEQTRAQGHLLIHAVGSSVGVALLQLGRLRGCEVAGTSRTQDKLDRAVALGLAHPVLVRERFLPPPHLEGWADVLCDLVGGSYLAGDLLAAAPRGRIIVIGLTGGRSAEIDLGLLLGRRLMLIGTVLRSRTADEKAALTASFAEQVLPALIDGRITPIVDRVFSLTEAEVAHRHLEENRNFGSVVLRVP